MSALGLPPYPPLPPNSEPSKIEEIRRTVYVGNLEKDCNGDDLMNFFNTNIGEVIIFLNILNSILNQKVQNWVKK